MLFNSFVFLCAVPADHLCGVLVAAERAAALRLAGTSPGYVFYGYWDPRFTLLMAFSTLVSYLAGLGFLRWQDPRHGGGSASSLPITVDLLLLGFFKYADFFVDSVRSGGACRSASDLAVPDAAHHPACRHLVLHLPHDQLHRRQLSRHDQADAEFLRVLRLCLAVFAARRRADRAIPADRSGPRSDRHSSTDALAGARHLILHHWARRRR